MKKYIKNIILASILLFSTSIVNGEVWYNWRYQEQTTDCTALTNGRDHDLCYEIDDSTLYKCESDDGVCDTSGEWKKIVGIPGGSDTQVQFNDNSTFGGDAGLTYIKATDNLIVAGQIDGGSLTLTNPLAISYGGTGQTTQQAAIDALTNVSGATNEHVLTKDTATGNAIFKASAGGGGTDTLDDVCDRGSDTDQNISITKADPEFKLTDNGNSEYTRVTRSDTNNLATQYNRVTKGGLGAYALDFDGSNDIVICGSDTTVDNIWDGGGSISAWVYVRSDGEANFGRVLTKYTTNAGWAVTTTGESAGKVKIDLYHYFSGTDGYWITTATEVTLNTWTHIVWTYNSSATTNHAIIYINGVAKTVGSGLTETTPTGTRDSDAAQILNIGNNAATSNTFDGQIEEVAIWHEILSANDVADLYAAGTGLYIDGDTTWATDGGSMGTNLVGLWHFDDGTGIYATDSSGNSNAGTLTNMTSGDWVSGYIALPMVEPQIWQSQNSGSPYGSFYKSKNTIGYSTGQTRISGKTINFDILGTEKAKFGIGGNLILTSGNDIRPYTDSTNALNIANAAGTDFVTFDTTNARIGLGIATPANILHIYKNTNVDGEANLRFDNPNAGTSSWAGMEFRNGTLGTQEKVGFGIGGTGFTLVPSLQDRGWIGTGTGLAGLVLGVANGDILFTVGATSDWIERMRLMYDGIITIERYTAGEPTALLRAGYADNNYGVGWQLQYRDTNGTAQYGLYMNTSGYVALKDATPVATLDVGGGTLTSIDGVDDAIIKDDLEVDGNAYIEGDSATVLTLGDGSAGVDYILRFNGETNDGDITWMEDEDTFNMSCNFSMNSGQAINEISTDTAMAGNSDTAVPTEKAVKAYADNLPHYQGEYGTGLDGNVTISSNTTMTADKHYANLTIDNGYTLITDGFKIYVSGTLTNNGTIDCSGGDGNLSFGGVPKSAHTLGQGANGGDSATKGGNIAIGAGGDGGAGGIGSTPAAGAGGTVTTPSANEGSINITYALPYAITNKTVTGLPVNAGAGGGGGSRGDVPSLGGGGGAGGGVILLSVRNVSALGVVTVKGGNGAAGTGNGAGGGGGGGGGVVILVTSTLAPSSTSVNVSGGTGGAGGGGAGAAASAGSAGRYIIIQN